MNLEARCCVSICLRPFVLGVSSQMAQRANPQLISSEMCCTQELAISTLVCVYVHLYVCMDICYVYTYVYVSVQYMYMYMYNVYTCTHMRELNRHLDVYGHFFTSCMYIFVHACVHVHITYVHILL